ncbi:cysteine rich secreted protein, putative [Ixodes scapularis]|uniref:Cysteine rich secreted protein, putative n=1 Tax=Ixodes scapularis TaxID=6945 RepID=B7P1C2_IXOSC|nr:cysteine rich secreted protein, putative [Ixodes scapularis]|eukprot:XP_002433330.1 cysteine rich secreted protein, putative [Ixodes scapularis]
MNPLAVLTVCVLAVVVSTTGDRRQGYPPIPYPLPKCAAGEVLKHCQSSSCAELSCAFPVPSSQCTLDCKTGCFCANGFFRNSRKKCVTRDQCP